jgi:hypothetical protein
VSAIRAIRRPERRAPATRHDRAPARAARWYGEASHGTAALSARAVIEATADVTVPVGPEEAYAALSDLRHADWLPGVKGLRHIGGPVQGLAARYEVEAGLVGRHLRGVLVCTEALPPERMVMTLEEGLDLVITATVRGVSGGCRVDLSARYSVGNGLAGLAMERASAGPARREVCRAVEQFAAQFGRKAPPVAERARRSRARAPR